MGGGSKSTKVTTGYKYYLTAQFVGCEGPIDELHGIDYGERSIWRGSITSTSPLYLSRESLFGGNKSEGGVAGTIGVNFGDQSQGRDSHLAAMLSPEIPAYRGYFGLVFRDFYFSANNPYLKSVWARVTKVLSGWSVGDAWYPEKAKISRYGGELVPHFIEINWDAEQIHAPQSITFKVETKGASDSVWSEIFSGQFTGGEFPQAIINTNTGAVNPFVGNSTNSTNFINGTTKSGNAVTPGVIPSATKTIKTELILEQREYRIVKTDGYRVTGRTVNSTGVVTTQTLVGLSYGGSISLKTSYTETPSYFDMNPAHILYRLLTDEKWQVRIPPSYLDDVAWKSAADTLFNENFGLSFAFSTGVSTKDHIQKVLSHINGYMKEDQATGLLQLKLMRNNYDVDDIANLNNSNSQLVSYEKVEGGKLPNTVIVTYRDDNEDTKLAPMATTPSSVNKFGEIRTDRDYEGIHKLSLAYNVAKRDAKILGSQLAKMTRKTDRVIWNYARGDVLTVTDEYLKMTNVPFRIVEIRKNFESYSPVIEVDLVEDIFGFDIGSFDVPDRYEDKYLQREMDAVNDFSLLELPYYLVKTSMLESEFRVLPDNYGIVATLTTRSTTGEFSTSYNVFSSMDNSFYSLTDEGAAYNPTGVTVDELDYLTRTFRVSNIADFTADYFTTIESEVFALINGEIMSVVGYNATTLEVTVYRGVLDTTPKKHAIGSRVVLFVPSGAIDPITRLDDDLVYYKPQALGNGEPLQLFDINSEYIVLDNRAERPYPPGAFAVSGVVYPSYASGPIEVTWAHRDRLLMTAGAVDHESIGVGPEPGTTYSIVVYDDGGVIVHSATGVTGTSYTVPIDDIAGLSELRITVESQRDGLTSWQKNDVTFERYGFGLQFGKSFGGTEQRTFGFGLQFGRAFGGI